VAESVPHVEVAGLHDQGIFQAFVKRDRIKINLSVKRVRLCYVSNGSQALELVTESSCELRNMSQAVVGSEA
jgi:hypothetical protein